MWLEPEGRGKPPRQKTIRRTVSVLRQLLRDLEDMNKGTLEEEERNLLMELLLGIGSGICAGEKIEAAMEAESETCGD